MLPRVKPRSDSHRQTLSRPGCRLLVASGVVGKFDGTRHLVTELRVSLAKRVHRLNVTQLT